MTKTPREMLLQPPGGGSHVFGFGRNAPAGVWFNATSRGVQQRVDWAKLQDQVAQQVRDAPENLTEWCLRRGIERSGASRMVNGDRWLAPHQLQTISEAIRTSGRAALVLPYANWPGKAGDVYVDYLPSDPEVVGMVKPMDDWREPIAANAAKHGPMDKREFAELRPRIRDAVARLVATRTSYADTHTLKVSQLRNRALSPVSGMLWEDGEQFIELFLPGNRAEQIAQLGFDTLPDGRFIVQICHWDDNGNPVAVHVIDIRPWSDAEPVEFQFYEAYELLG